MAVKRHRDAVDHQLGITFDDHAIVMSRHRTRALITHAGDSPLHDERFLTSGFYPATVARRIAYSDDTAHRILLI